MNRKIVWLTISDRHFFPGTLALVNSIEHYHPGATIAVISSGEFNDPLTKPQIGLLNGSNIRFFQHSCFAGPTRILGAWQLKAYGAYDLSKEYDMIIFADSDAVLCDSIEDVIEHCFADGKIRGGQIGDGITYGSEYSAYGFATPARSDKYLATSLCFVPVNEANVGILKEWASACDQAFFGPQKDKVYAGRGDQAVLNAVIYKHTQATNVELLPNNLFSQHGVSRADVIDCAEAQLINRSFGNQKMRSLHSGRSRRFWSAKHSASLPIEGQNQTWSYAHWLTMLWFGKFSDWELDPYQWLPAESQHLCRDLIMYFHHIETLFPDLVNSRWPRLSIALLTRVTELVPRTMPISGSMFQYIRLAGGVQSHGTIVEVGSYLGGSVLTLAIALLHRRLRVVSVESFMGNLDGTVDGHKLASPAEYLKNVKHLFPYLNVITLPLDSMNASRHFKDETVDMVFIDGNHSTSAVIADIRAWWPKLKSGGLLAGDDIRWRTVRAAIECEFGNHYQKGSNLWWTTKRSGRRNG
jgi:predicted O-methyltransferase YrrM